MDHLFLKSRKVASGLVDEKTLFMILLDEEVHVTKYLQFLFLLIFQNFFYETKRDRITNFMDFMYTKIKSYLLGLIPTKPNYSIKKHKD